MSDTPSKTPITKTSADASAEVPQHIGRKLREMFDYIAEQPVPDRFKALLDQLEQTSPASKAE